MAARSLSLGTRWRKEGGCLLGSSSAVWSGRSLPTFQRNKLPPSWRWVPLKHRKTSTRLHCAATQKTVIFILAAVRTSNPTQMEASSISCPSHFVSGETGPDTHWIRDWVNPRDDLDAMAKREISIPVWNRTSLSSSQPSRFTDWATSPPRLRRCTTLCSPCTSYVALNLQITSVSRTQGWAWNCELESDAPAKSRECAFRSESWCWYRPVSGRNGRVGIMTQRKHMIRHTRGKSCMWRNVRGPKHFFRFGHVRNTFRNKITCRENT
jgi:hypothetical protein